MLKNWYAYLPETSCFNDRSCYRFQVLPGEAFGRQYVVSTTWWLERKRFCIQGASTGLTAALSAHTLLTLYLCWALSNSTWLDNGKGNAYNLSSRGTLRGQ